MGVVFTFLFSCDSMFLISLVDCSFGQLLEEARKNWAFGILLLGTSSFRNYLIVL